MPRKKKEPEVPKEPAKNKIVIDKFIEMYLNKNGIAPSVTWAACGKMINDLLKEHSVNGLMRIIELYFEDEDNDRPGKVYYLPSILSSWSLNKYLPRLRYNPQIYANAEELNKDLY